MLSNVVKCCKQQNSMTVFVIIGILNDFFTFLTNWNMNCPPFFYVSRERSIGKTFNSENQPRSSSLSNYPTPCCWSKPVVMMIMISYFSLHYRYSTYFVEIINLVRASNNDGAVASFLPKNNLKDKSIIFG